MQSRTCLEVRAGGHCDLRGCRKLQAGLAALQLIHISNNSLGAELHTANPPLIHEALQPGSQSEMTMETAYCKRCCSHSASVPSLSHHLPHAAVSPTDTTRTPGEVGRQWKSHQLVPEELYMSKLLGAGRCCEGKRGEGGKHKVSYPPEHHTLPRAQWLVPGCRDLLPSIWWARHWSPCLCVSQHS